MSASTWSTRWQQFQTLPRAVRWLAIALVTVVAFIVVNDYVWAIGRYWHEKADTIERKVTDAGDKAQREQQARALQTAVVALGPVEMPDSLAESQETLRGAVTSVLAKYRSVTGSDSFDPKGAATMPEVLRGALPGKRIERISGEVRFDASVEDAIAIIADLESHPAIESVTTVRIIRQSSIKKVRVNLTVDAWVITEGVQRRGVANV
jgi:hypothetical protein